MIIKSSRDIKLGSVLFIAEGESEVGYISRFLHNNDLDAPVMCMKGITGLKTILTSVFGIPGFDNIKALYIMLDADNSKANRIESVYRILMNFSIIIDKQKVMKSEICCDSPCKVAIYVSSGKDGTGSIEDLLIEQISDHKLSNCIKDYAACVKSITGDTITKKSLVQFFISTMDGSLCGVGRAFEKGIFDLNHPVYRSSCNLILQVMSIV